MTDDPKSCNNNYNHKNPSAMMILMNPYINATVKKPLFILAFFFAIIFVIQRNDVFLFQAQGESSSSIVEVSPENTSLSSNNSMIRSRSLQEQQDRNLGGIDSFHPKAPALAWLMSFPDSGTTYSISSITQATQKASASNYGNMFMRPNGEIIRDQLTSIPIYSNRPNGPYLFSGLELPENYILVKTHCGGHCTDCYPGRYMKGPNQYWKECHTSARFDPKYARAHPGKDPYEYLVYSDDLVKRAVHLIRNPFDNIVSRFHHEYRLATIRNNVDFTNTYQYNSEGFHKWCEYLGNKFSEEESKWYDQWNKKSILEPAQSVPCHMEFYKYVQWHNNAFFVTSEAMNIPTLVTHYEDYANDLEGTVKKIADFYELPVVGKPADFHFHTYEDYFTEVERENTIKFIKILAGEELWDNLMYYKHFQETSTK